MTHTATRHVEVDVPRRPGAVVVTGTMLAVLGIGAVLGGVGMVLGIGGESMLPDEYLDLLPLVNNWVVPGLVLAIGFGIGSLVTLYGMLTRPKWTWLQSLEKHTGHHWSWVATIAIGVGQVVWILIELATIPFSVLMPIFGVIGLALALLPSLTSVKEYLRTS